MAVIPLKDVPRSQYDTPLRQEWQGKIAKLGKVVNAVKFLRDFRAEYSGYGRKNWDLLPDAAWIEVQIENKLALLREQETSCDDDLLNKCASGECATEVATTYKRRMEAVDCKYEREKIMAEFRQLFKAPIMPVNKWLETDTYLGARLLEARAGTFFSQSLEELRAERGVKVVVA